MSKRQAFFRLLNLIRPFWRGMLGSILLSLATIGSSVSLMATSAWLISTAGLQLGIASLGVAPPMVRFLGIARAIFRYLERLVSHNLTFRLLARLRVWFYRAIEPLAPARLMSYRSGDLLGRVVSDVETLENIFLRVIAPPIVALFIGFAMTLFMIGFDPFIALIFVSGYLLAGTALPFLAWRTGEAVGRRYITKRAELNTYLIDTLQGMADIVAYGDELRQLAHLNALNDDLIQTEWRMAFWDGLQTGLSVLLVHLTAWGVLLVAISRVDGVFLGTLTLATIASFEAIQALIPAVHHLGENIASAQRLFEVIDTEPPIHLSEKPLSLPAQPMTLNMADVTFGYQSTTPVLKQINLNLLSGKMIAIVGASGAGKSTLTHLILRFWDVDAGKISLNGVDIRHLHPDELRRHFSVMTQRTHLFNTTLRENISIARDGVTEADLYRACEQAQLMPFIQKLSDGLLTDVGELGFALSGGERQRVALARMLIKDAPIWILDEPTANLDAITEMAILETILGVRGDKLVLLITHRLTHLDRVDEILVLEDGHLVEQGTHDHLIRQQGAYWQLWQLQQRRIAVR